MISIAEAKKLLDEQVEALLPVQLTIAEAVDRVLAEDIFSPVDLPLFDQSAMDGYAVRMAAEKNSNSFELVGEIKAGDAGAIQLAEGQAVRIFTGAPVPVTADAVVIQEKVTEKQGIVYVDGRVTEGAFIRKKSAQAKMGNRVLRKGAVVTPAMAGFLASMGIRSVQVSKRPCVSLLVTGNEIISPGQPLLPGQVYECNSFSIRAALKQFQVPVQSTLFAKDERKDLFEQVETGLRNADLLLITGGISAGKYDLVGEVLQELGVETIFYKVAQKPGKPLFAGKLGKKIVFALPGNPASVLVCFYQYVFPAIRKMMGYSNADYGTKKLPLLRALRNEDGRDCFFRAKLEKNGVLPLEGQDSYMLHSFASADAFILIAGDKKFTAEGEEVEVHPVPRHLNCF